MNGSTSIGRIVRRLSLRAAWAPVTVVVLHAVLGQFLGHEPYVDPAMHLLGGVAAAFFIRYACAVGRVLLGQPTHLALDLLALGLTCTAAFLWELGEFLADLFFGTGVQRGAANTMRDLVLGVLGALLYIGAARLVRGVQGSRGGAVIPGQG